MAEISGKASFVRVAALAAGLAVILVGGARAAGEDDLAFRLSPLGSAPTAVGSAPAAAGPIPPETCWAAATRSQIGPTQSF